MVGGIMLSQLILYILSLSQYKKFVKVWGNDISYFQPDL